MDSSRLQTNNPSFWRQYCALLKKNFIIKNQTKRLTLAEIVFPVYFLMILYFVSRVSPPINIHTDPVYHYPSTSLTDLSFLTCNARDSCQMIGLVASGAAPGALEDVLHTASNLLTAASVEFQLFSDESNLLQFYSQHPGRLFAAVIFEETPENGGVDYTLRFNGTTPFESMANFETSGAMQLQIIAQQAILRNVLPKDKQLPNIQISTQKFPTPPSDFSLNLFEDIWGMYFIFGFMQTAHQFCTLLVSEKHSKVKEGLKVMGCSGTAYYLSWFTTQATFGFLSILILQFMGNKIFGLITKSNFFVIFSIFGLYLLCLLNVGALISVFFDNPKTVGTVNFLVTFLIAGTYAIARYAIFPLGHVTQSTLGLLSLVPGVPFGEGMLLLSEAEMSGDGLNWSHLDVAQSGVYTLRESLLWLFVDTLIYGFLAWYLEQVIPGEYGTTRPFYFLFTPSYWSENFSFFFRTKAELSGIGSGDFLDRSRRSTDSAPLLHPMGSMSALNINQNFSGGSGASTSGISPDSSEGEPEIDSNGASITLHNLRKVFKKGKSNQQTPPNSGGVSSGGAGGVMSGTGGTSGVFGGASGVSPPQTPPGNGVVAVEGLNMTLKKGEIFCLLGHNGAGKSTVISMLTGLCPPTSGTAVFNEIVEKRSFLDLRCDLNVIRRNLGVCPQHDILFPKLTARQHLNLFADLKGIPKNRIQSEINQILREVGLEKEGDIISENFSGGMKRKLCVAIAFIGNPSVIFLDEPSSGMDPMSRRKIWSLLQKNKNSKIIVLTTHSMEEADLLGDTIAIMSHGKLECLGPSLSLKMHYGIGYHLTLVLTKSGGGDRAESEAARSGVFGRSENDQVRRRRISEFIGAFIPGHELLSDHGSELVFTLPLSAVGVFPRFLRELENPEVQASFGFSSFGLSMTTLEEVFLRIANLAEASNNNSQR